MQIVHRLDVGERRAHSVLYLGLVERGSGKLLLGGCEPQRTFGGGADADGDALRLAVVAERDLRRRRHKGEVAAPGIHFKKRDADLVALPNREVHAGEAGAGRQRGDHRADEEFIRRHVEGLAA